jgi:cytochrome d ubiquinol oxidase subunit I
MAILAGWVVTEAGRQPYVVYGMLRTADAVSTISPVANLATLLFFMLVYVGLFFGFLWYWLRIVLNPPSVPSPIPLAGTRTATVPASLPGGSS